MAWDDRRIFGAAFFVLAAACGAVGIGPDASRATPGIDEALADLQAGRLQQAERIAFALANDQSGQYPRTWLIVATVRQRQMRYGLAIRAYRKFLSSCDSTELRNYVLDQIGACKSALEPQEPPKAPSKRLTAAELEKLAIIDRIIYTESTEHFVVRTRNAVLAKLVAAEAESSLRRICRELLGGQEYPHSVDIYVWADRADYLANAPASAPEWSGGSFTILYEGDFPTRRIDLTQLDPEGRLDAVMLDRILPHEMCHLVVREFFGDRPCPLAVNEGLAMLAEAEVDNERVILAGKALMGQNRISVEKLLVAEPTGMSSKEVFYAESFSFLDYVHSRLTRRQFKAFLEYVKSDCPVGEAIQRALYMPSSDAFMPDLEAAWEEQAIADRQVLEAISAKRART
jgi:hypothetical protein